VRLGTRGSALARRQTDQVADRLLEAHPRLQIAVEIVSTHGDQRPDVPLSDFGSAGAFTSNLEWQVRAGLIDLAVHSYKDLPTDSQPGAVIGATPPRHNPADVLVSRGGHKLDTLPRGATVGTGSRRRAAQLLRYRPDLRILDIRGNVDTRLNKLFAPGGAYDAIVLAYAGLARLARLDVISQILPLEIMLPAPAQAALAVQCRDEYPWRALLNPINDPETECAVTAERTFLAALDGGCSLPVAAYAEVVADQLRLTGRVVSPDGTSQIDVSAAAPFADTEAAVALGQELADEAKGQGALAILETVR
jgi:hydroxymethylbilane synthase